MTATLPGPSSAVNSCCPSPLNDYKVLRILNLELPTTFEGSSVTTLEFPSASEDFLAMCEELYSLHYAEVVGDDATCRRWSRTHAGLRLLLGDEFCPDGTEVAPRLIDDRTADGGIDWVHVDETNQSLLVVQFKDANKTSPSELKTWARALIMDEQALTSSKRAASGWTETKKENARLLRTKADYTRQYFLVLTSTSYNGEEIDHGYPLPEGASIDVLDVKALLVREAERNSTRPTDITLRFKENQAYVVTNQSTVPLIQGLISVADYANLTNSFGQHLFRLNPRLHLGEVKINRGIRSTLADAIENRFFHAYNNGITAVCKTLTVTHEGDELVAHCEDFQVVNGCQTTESLWWAVKNGCNLNDVHVALRILEGSTDLARKVSTYTNRQSSISDADLISSDDAQQQIKAALDRATPPVFYESRRGEWAAAKLAGNIAEYQVKAPVSWNTSSPAVRRISLKELGQALLAVTGKPNSAKEQVTQVFAQAGLFGAITQSADSEDDPTAIIGDYERLYARTWHDPEQLALVADLYRYSEHAKDWLPSAVHGPNSTLMESAAVRQLANLGRFYVCALVYSHWRNVHGVVADDADNAPLLPAEASAQIRTALPAQATPYAQLGVKALARVLGKPAPDGPAGDRRNMLRQKRFQMMIFQEFELLRDASL